MADCNDLFGTYYDKVRLTGAKRSYLKTSRDANRALIRTYFRDTLKQPVPRFSGQGSYRMHSGVNPLSGDYDIDDGVYLQGLGTDPAGWPTPETVHGWIVEAVKGRTSERPKDKARCVRVRYAADYHVDLPIYAMDASDTPRLFEKGLVPYQSDPRAFADWFCAKAAQEGQLRRLVRFLKGWRDAQGGAALIAQGVELTILVANHAAVRVRDDEALAATARAIANHLDWGGTIQKPVSPHEDLTADWSDSERSDFTALVRQLAERGQDALDEEDLPTASGIWRQLLGDRFPEVKDDTGSSGALKTSRPAILGYDGRSA